MQDLIKKHRYNTSYEPQNSVIFLEQFTPLKFVNVNYFEEHLFHLEVETKLKIHSKIKPTLPDKFFDGAETVSTGSLVQFQLVRSPV